MEDEREVLVAAVERIKVTAGVKLVVADAATGTTTSRGEAVLWLKHGGRKTSFLAVVKRGVTTNTVHFVARRLKEIAQGQNRIPLLITEFVSESVGKMLREMDVQYLDTAGNAHLHAEGVHILIEGKKKPKTDRMTRPGGDPFGWAGLKVVFALLCAEDLRSAAYRDIAKSAGVALGTVGGVMTELERRKHLMRVGDEVRLRNQKDLMQLWVTAYIDKLRPKLFLGRFEAIEGLDTREAVANGALLGAETAAMHLRKHLRPGIDTLYITGQMTDWIARMRLRKDPTGSLELRRRFWEFEYPEKKLGIVPPLMMYADLLAVGDPRTIDAAEMTYDEYLARYLEEA